MFKLCTIILLMIISTCFSQKLLFHKTTYKEAIYKTGDFITFKLKNNKAKITEEILGFEDSLIVFQDLKVNPKDITRLYIDNKTQNWQIRRNQYSSTLIAAGIGYFLISAINSRKFTEKNLNVSASFIATGLLIRFLMKDYYKIKGQRKLLIIN